jgi:hypothetical protein
MQMLATVPEDAARKVAADMMNRAARRRCSGAAPCVGARLTAGASWLVDGMWVGHGV